MYYPCSENKDADQLCSYRKADLRLCFAHANCWFSHAQAQILSATNQTKVDDFNEYPHIWRN